MEQLLREYLDIICLIYLDDIMIMGKTFEEMLINFEQIFTKLRDANLRLNKKKCHFFKRETEYLGHIVSEKGISTVPKKICEK